MKNIFKFLAILFFFFYQKGYSQQLVQNIDDLYRLIDNKEQFINKPLKNLLKEIKPEIKITFPSNEPPLFDFRFVTSEQLRKNEGTIYENVSLFIGVKDFIDWKWGDRPKGREPNWTKEDAEKYGNMIVTRINVVY